MSGKQKLLLFAGTTEGRMLAEQLAGILDLVVCVATAYGRALIPEELDGVHIHTGRLDAAGMAALMERTQFAYAVDATHPYAAEASENIRAACDATGTPYLRLLRPESDGEWIAADSPEQAAARLDRMEGKALLTVGSKELAAFTQVRDYRERLVVRVLPMAEALAHCLELGFPPKNIVCMQGPFSAELNAAMLRQAGASVLVTKESGRAGGFPEKLEGAAMAGARVIVIGRPCQEAGYPLEMLAARLRAEFGKGGVL